MSERPDVLVVGGGVVGVCTAHFLIERGVRTTLLERGEICSGASHGNGGWIFPSESAPIPEPGVIRKALPWLLDPESPFWIRPRASLALLRWLWDFRRACNANAVRESFRLRRALSLASLDRFTEFAKKMDFDFGFTQRGLTLIFRTAKAMRDAQRDVELLEAAGGSAKWLGVEELRGRVPSLSADLAGGLEFPDDAHLTPDDFVRGLAADVARRGAAIETHTEVLGVEWSRRGPVRVRTTRGDFRADEVVLAAGAWTPELTRGLGLRVPVEAAKGYSITVERPEGHPDLPLALVEGKSFVTPMGSRLRFGGTLELAGLDMRMNQRRVDALARTVRSYLPGLPRTPTVEIWRGLRPLTPDDLPILGRPAGTSGLILATGHGMSGISQGPISGELVAQLACGETPEIDLAPFSPDRF
ncbi:MAG: FAD-dependent oxidoreductase [Myxococcales bacterium]|nr:FAD-dependent oxidoreductase [Myxococcales bacterium]